MLYDDLAIKRIGERKIWESIKNRDSYSLTSKSEDMQLMIRAVESYIVKYYHKFNPQAKKRIDELVDSIFTIYSKHPHMATYSEILSNQHIVEYLTKDNSKRKKCILWLQLNYKKTLKKYIRE